MNIDAVGRHCESLWRARVRKSLNALIKITCSMGAHCTGCRGTQAARSVSAEGNDHGIRRTILLEITHANNACLLVNLLERNCQDGFGRFRLDGRLLRLRQVTGHTPKSLDKTIAANHFNIISGRVVETKRTSHPTGFDDLGQDYISVNRVALQIVIVWTLGIETACKEVYVVVDVRCTE